MRTFVLMNLCYISKFCQLQKNSSRLRILTKQKKTQQDKWQFEEFKEPNWNLPDATWHVSILDLYLWSALNI